MSSHSSQRKSPPTYPGLFITFEGPEGSGKTTQCQHLAQWLQTNGQSVLITREPGGTPIAEAIRNLLLTKKTGPQKHETITPVCEAALVLAARSQHVTHTIVPALQKGMIVLCDRFFDSTLAYQGFGRGLNREALTRFNDFATGGIRPTLTFLLDLPVKEGLQRRKKASKQNRMDQESLAFHERVHRGFITLARQDAKRWRKLDAQQSPEQLAEEIIRHIQPMVPKSISPRKKRTSNTRLATKPKKSRA
ncbi:MAG: dTMP kinase [Nitrospirales bacterium]|nr:dTMP kinase [Nitrospirales bacterium]